MHSHRLTKRFNKQTAFLLELLVKRGPCLLVAICQLQGILVQHQLHQVSRQPPQLRYREGRRDRRQGRCDRGQGET